MANQNIPLLRSCKTLPTLRLELEDEFARRKGDGPHAPVQRACKTLPGLKLERDEDQQ